MVMKVLCYLSDKLKTLEAVPGQISAAAPSALQRTFRSLADLTDELRRPTSAPTLLLLFPANPEELDGMVSIRHLLKESAVILILPDRDERSKALGYRLTPRFMTYADHDLSEVLAVMGRIAEQYKKNGLARQRESLWQ